jgi:flagellar motility protein MotE (MotC chaperone)
MKAVLVYMAAAVGAFIILVGITFAVLTFLEQDNSEAIRAAVIMDNKVLAAQIIEDKEKAIDSLSAAISELNSKLFFAGLVEDSLQEVLEFNQSVIEQYKKQIEQLNKQVGSQKKLEGNIAEVAKTYESMKVEEIRPIFERLDDETVIGIYQNVSSRNRKKILQALSHNRAAAITQWLAGEKNK